jgi:hypothetical protein
MAFLATPSLGFFLADAWVAAADALRGDFRTLLGRHSFDRSEQGERTDGKKGISLPTSMRALAAGKNHRYAASRHPAR